jgi:hypothetical protein
MPDDFIIFILYLFGYSVPTSSPVFGDDVKLSYSLKRETILDKRDVDRGEGGKKRETMLEKK